MDTLQPTEHDERVERRVRDLEACVERLSERISALEVSVRTDPVPRQVSIDSPRADTLSAPPPPSGPPPGFGGQAPPPTFAERAPRSFGGQAPLDAPPRSFGEASHEGPTDLAWITLTGRTFLVLAGAFLLRALTDTGRLPAAPGVWIGLAYALLWLVLADARGGRSGLVHALTSLVIALPLVAEGATRFHVVDATGAAIALGVVTLGALAVAWRRRLAVLGLAAIVGLSAAALVSAISIGAFLPPTLAVVITAIVACGVAATRRWPTLAWFAAFSANFAAVLLTVRAIATPALEPAGGSLFTVALVGIGFVGLFLWRTRRPPTEAGVFEAAQTTAALAVAIGAAVPIARAGGINVHFISIPVLLAGLALFTHAFTVVVRVRGAGPQFYWAGMTAFGLTLAGTVLSIAPPVQTIVLATSAIAAAMLAVWQAQPLLALQGTLAAVAAAVSAGLMSLVMQVWLTRLHEWPVPSIGVWIVLAATLAALLIPRSLRHEEPSPMAMAARLALALTLSAGLSTALVLQVGPWLTGAIPDPGVTATIKSVVLAAATFAVGLASRAPRFRELIWLTYALMGAGALKIVLEDFPVSSPSTLFVALAAFGAVLIAVPRITREGTKE